MVKFHQCTAIAGLLGLMTACTDDPSLITSATDSDTDSATDSDADSDTGDDGDTESTSTGEGPESTTSTSVSTAATDDPSDTSTGTSTSDSSTGDDSTGDETTGDETTGDNGVPIPGCGDHVLVIDKLNLGGHTSIQDFSDFCAHYDGVDGDLVLATPYHDDEPLPDFSGLECLRCVTGDLSIQYAGVESLTGLDNLVRVGSLTLTVLPHLTDLQGLGSLEEITGPFLLRMDHWAYVPSELTSLAGLDSLLRIGELIIEHSDALESLDGLESVSEIGALELRELPLLADLDGLLGLHSLASLSISYNDTLADLYGLINVDTPIDNLYMRDNPALLDLVGAPPLAPFATLSLADLPAIVDLWGLHPLPSDLTHIYLDELPGITDLSPLADLRRLQGSLVIRFCDGLEDLHGLEQLESVVGSLTFDWNPALKSLSALSGLTDAHPAALQIQESPLLTSLVGLEGIVELRGAEVDDPTLYAASSGYSEIGGVGLHDLTGLDNLAAVGTETPKTLIIHDSPALESLSGLESLSECSGLAIFRNHELTDLTALAGLTHLDDLMISDNDGLVSLAGLESLVEVGDGDLEISDNALVNNLDPLAGLKSISEVLEITNNCSLTDADADVLVATITDGGGQIKSTEIGGNGAKCEP